MAVEGARRTALAMALLTLAMVELVTAAPAVSESTELENYDGESGCYYNFQHYGEGDRIMTNEPCLNCTCHNRMLMCYLRVCPFTKPIGQDCVVEKRGDQCCPIITCPDVPVDLETSTPSLPSSVDSTEVGHHDNYGCSIDNRFYSDGAQVPSKINKPCELCYCIRNMTACVMQECTLHVEGCTPVYQRGVCCPVRYSCDHPENEEPLMLDDLTTTVRPTPGFLLTTTLAPGYTSECTYHDQVVADGALIETDKPCEHCYCMKGDIVCAVQECGTPMENEGKNCTAMAPRENQCCPDTYMCDGDEEPTTPASDLNVLTTTQRADEEHKLAAEKTTLTPADDMVHESSTERKLDASGEEIIPEENVTEHEDIESSTDKKIVDESHEELPESSTEPKIDGSIKEGSGATDSDAHATTESSNEVDKEDRTTIKYDEHVKDDESNVTDKSDDDSQTTPSASDSFTPVRDNKGEDQIHEDDMKIPESATKVPQHRDEGHDEYTPTEHDLSQVTEGIIEREPVTEGVDQKHEFTEKPDEKLDDQQISTDIPKESEEMDRSSTTTIPIDDLSKPTTHFDDESATKTSSDIVPESSTKLPEIATEQQIKSDTTDKPYDLYKETDGQTEKTHDRFPEAEESDSGYATTKGPSIDSLEDIFTTDYSILDHTDVSIATSSLSPEITVDDVDKQATESPIDDLHEGSGGKLDVLEDQTIQPTKESSEDLAQTTVKSSIDLSKPESTEKSSEHDVPEVTTDKEKESSEPAITHSTETSTVGITMPIDDGVKETESSTPKEDTVDFTTTKSVRLEDEDHDHAKPDQTDEDKEKIDTTTKLPTAEDSHTISDDIDRSSTTISSVDEGVKATLVGDELDSTTVRGLDISATEKINLDDDKQQTEKPILSETDISDDDKQQTEKPVSSEIDISDEDEHQTEKSVYSETDISSDDKQQTETPTATESDISDDDKQQTDKPISSDISEDDKQQTEKPAATESDISDDDKQQTDKPISSDISEDDKQQTEKPAVTESDISDDDKQQTDKPISSDISEDDKQQTEKPAATESDISDGDKQQTDKPISSDISEDDKQQTDTPILPDTVTSDVDKQQTETPISEDTTAHSDDAEKSPDHEPESTTKISDVKEYTSKPEKDVTDSGEMHFTSDGVTAYPDEAKHPEDHSKLSDDQSEITTKISDIQDHTEKSDETEMPEHQTADVSEVSDELESTTLPALISSHEVDEQENEINEDDLPRIPGEGDCLVDGTRYRNSSQVPTTNKCQISCYCLNSILKCDQVSCPPPPADMVNCQPVYHARETCCPMYACEHVEPVTIESGNQMSGITTVQPLKAGITEVPDLSDKTSTGSAEKDQPTTVSTIKEEPEDDKIVPVVIGTDEKHQEEVSEEPIVPSVHKPDCGSEKCSVPASTTDDIEQHEVDISTPSIIKEQPIESSTTHDVAEKEMTTIVAVDSSDKDMTTEKESVAIVTDKPEEITTVSTDAKKPDADQTVTPIESDVTDKTTATMDHISLEKDTLRPGIEEQEGPTSKPIDSEESQEVSGEDRDSTKPASSDESSETTASSIQDSSEADDSSDEKENATQDSAENIATVEVGESSTPSQIDSKETTLATSDESSPTDSNIISVSISEIKPESTTASDIHKETSPTKDESQTDKSVPQESATDSETQTTQSIEHEPSTTIASEESDKSSSAKADDESIHDITESSDIKTTSESDHYIKHDQPTDATIQSGDDSTTIPSIGKESTTQYPVHDDETKETSTKSIPEETTDSRYGPDLSEETDQQTVKSTDEITTPVPSADENELTIRPVVDRTETKIPSEEEQVTERVTEPNASQPTSKPLETPSEHETESDIDTTNAVTESKMTGYTTLKPSEQTTISVDDVNKIGVSVLPTDTVDVDCGAIGCSKPAVDDKPEETTNSDGGAHYTTQSIADVTTVKSSIDKDCITEECKKAQQVPVDADKIPVCGEQGCEGDDQQNIIDDSEKPACGPSGCQHDLSEDSQKQTTISHAEEPQEITPSPIGEPSCGTEGCVEKQTTSGEDTSQEVLTTRPYDEKISDSATTIKSTDCENGVCATVSSTEESEKTVEMTKPTIIDDKQTEKPIIDIEKCGSEGCTEDVSTSEKGAELDCGGNACEQKPIDEAVTDSALTETEKSPSGQITEKPTCATPECQEESVTDKLKTETPADISSVTQTSTDITSESLCDNDGCTVKSEATTSEGEHIPAVTDAPQKVEEDLAKIPEQSEIACTSEKCALDDSQKPVTESTVATDKPSDDSTSATQSDDLGSQTKIPLDIVTPTATESTKLSEVTTIKSIDTAETEQSTPEKTTVVPTIEEDEELEKETAKPLAQDESITEKDVSEQPQEQAEIDEQKKATMKPDLLEKTTLAAASTDKYDTPTTVYSVDVPESGTLAPESHIKDSDATTVQTTSDEDQPQTTEKLDVHDIHTTTPDDATQPEIDDSITKKPITDEESEKEITQKPEVIITEAIDSSTVKEEHATTILPLPSSPADKQKPSDIDSSTETGSQYGDDDKSEEDVSIETETPHKPDVEAEKQEPEIITGKPSDDSDETVSFTTPKHDVVKVTDKPITESEETTDKLDDDELHQVTEKQGITDKVRDESTDKPAVEIPIKTDEPVKQLQDVTDNPEESQDVTDKPAESQDVTDKPEESHEVTDKPAESQDVTDKLEESQDATDKPAESQEVTDTPAKSQDVTDKSAESQVVTDKPAESQDVTDKPEESQDVTDKPAESQDVTDKLEESQDVTDKPAESQDVTDKPAKSQDVTDKPAESQDVTDKPAKSQDVTDKPAKSQDVTDKPAESQDVTDKPAESQDVTDKPAESQDVTDKPAESQDVTDKPAEPQDVTDKPAKSQDVTDKPAESQDVTDKPAESQDVTDKPAESQDVTDKPAESQYFTDKPAESQDVTDKPAESQDITDKPAESQDVTDKPAKSQDVTDKPKETHDITDKPAGAQDVTDKPAESQDVTDKSAESQETTYKPSKSQDVTVKPEEETQDVTDRSEDAIPEATEKSEEKIQEVTDKSTEELLKATDKPTEETSDATESPEDLEKVTDKPAEEVTKATDKSEEEIQVVTQEPEQGPHDTTDVLVGESHKATDKPEDISSEIDTKPEVELDNKTDRPEEGIEKETLKPAVDQHPVTDQSEEEVHKVTQLPAESGTEKPIEESVDSATTSKPSSGETAKPDDITKEPTIADQEITTEKAVESQETLKPEMDNELVTEISSVKLDSEVTEQPTEGDIKPTDHLDEQQTDKLEHADEHKKPVSVDDETVTKEPSDIETEGELSPSTEVPVEHEAEVTDAPRVPGEGLEDTTMKVVDEVSTEKMPISDVDVTTQKSADEIKTTVPADEDVSVTEHLDDIEKPSTEEKPDVVKQPIDDSEITIPVTESEEMAHETEKSTEIDDASKVELDRTTEKPDENISTKLPEAEIEASKTTIKPAESDDAATESYDDIHKDVVTEAKPDVIPESDHRPDHTSELPETTRIPQNDTSQEFTTQYSEPTYSSSTTSPLIEMMTTKLPAHDITSKPSIEQETISPVHDRYPDIDSSSEVSPDLDQSELPIPSPGEDIEHQQPEPGYGTSGGDEPDYEEEEQPFGPGTCRYGGKVYVSAQQIPRDDPCDFCFCFRSDIICLQQSCPPPIQHCHEEPIQGFCCPRYECPVSMATVLNVTTTTTTTTTTLPPHFLSHAYKGAAQRRGCQINGQAYKVGEVIKSASGPCLNCTCGGDGQMKCDPKVCTPEPMLRQMIAVAATSRRRR